MKTRSQDWTQEQVALLVAMYPTRPMKDIAEATGRTIAAIYVKARHMKIARENQAKFGKANAPEGHKFPKGHKPWNAGRSQFKVTSRDLVLGEFKRNPVQTTKSLSAATGVRRSGCWTICNGLVKAGKAHISGWRCGKETNWNKEAEYTFGPGESLPWTPRQKSDDSDPYEIQPIPTPPIGLWGICWPTINHAGHAPVDGA